MTAMGVVAQPDCWVVSLREVMDNFPDGAIVVFDRELRYMAAGGRGLSKVGLSVSMLEGRTIWEVFPPNTAARIEPMYRAALLGDESIIDVPFEGRVYSQHAAPVRTPDGEIVGGMVATHDITELRRSTDQVRIAEEQFRTAFEHAPIGMALVALDGRFTRVNRALCEIVGYDEAELLLLTFQQITHPDDLQIDLGHVERLVAGEIDSYRMEKRYFDARGRIVWVQLSGSMVRDAQGDPMHFVAQIEDISQRKREEAQLTRMAQRDPLTGLLNRAMFDRDLTSYQQAAERYGDQCSLLIIDLDDFKAINDSAGHHAGDETLQRVASVFRSRVRITDHVYRIGGDEFAVLLPHASHAAATTVADSLRRAVAEIEVIAAGTAKHIGASIGISAVDPGGATSPRHTADLAMYAEKERRRADGAAQEAAAGLVERPTESGRPVPNEYPTVP